MTAPAGGHAGRTGDLIPQIAVDDRNRNLYVVWQDDRFTGQQQIAFSRISKIGGVNQAFTATVRVADNGTVAALRLAHGQPGHDTAAHHRHVGCA